jgi:glycosyltransferase involved in cell wall biosynthesis
MNIPDDKAQLTIVGRLAIPTVTFDKYASRVRHVSHVPRSEIAGFFTGAECFVFPSLFEGSAIVLNEACGAGLGIIQTDRSGDGARCGQNGRVLKEISVPALTEAVDQIASDRGLRERWQAASWARRETRTWTDYRTRVASLVSSTFSKP